MTDAQTMYMMLIIVGILGIMLFYFMEKCFKQDKQLKTLRAFLIMKCEKAKDKPIEEIYQAIEDIIKETKESLPRHPNCRSKPIPYLPCKFKDIHSKKT